jgi:GT2 family glycosyltransferase
MTISIVVINFNTPEVTLNCLRSINRYWKNISYEIILVDNAPKLDYRLHFLEVSDCIKYIHSEKNVGFGKANNIGMHAAKGDFLLLLNSDTIVFDDSILKCLHFFELPENKAFGMLGCRLLNEDLSHQSSFYPFVKDSLWNFFKCNNPLLFKLFGIDKKYSEISMPKEVGDISGAFMLLRKEVFETTGGFDPDFFLYCEETEWCRNRIQPNYKIIYFPESEIIHLGGQSAPKPMMLVQSNISLALYWYKKKSFLLPFFILINLLNGIFFAFQYIFCSKDSKESIRKWCAVFWYSLPYWIFDIPKYGNKFGERKELLIYKEAKPIFFSENTD